MSIIDKNENYPEQLQYRLDKVKVDAKVAAAKEQLRTEIKRSVSIFRVDTGTCNGCDIEYYAAITPLFDVERFGIKNASSPRHADILVMEGPLNRPMRMPALRAYEAAPDSTLVMAYGASACTGGIYQAFYANWGGIDKLFPVDVYLPGCPPTPEQFIYAFCILLDKLAQKLHAEHDICTAQPESPIPYNEMPYKPRIYIERKARQMAGYLNAETVQKILIPAMAKDADPLSALGEAVGQTDDPRLSEIYRALKEQVEALCVTQADQTEYMRKTLIEVVRNTDPLDDNQALDILANALTVPGR
ncbi:MAG: NADH-quinone oxidoreductase subunit B family protein [Eggerthellaceae bacterium]|nr:NADH-quinone oxidoreductase subunit B family protein [Eggerthellaceae bacterium]